MDRSFSLQDLGTITITEDTEINDAHLTIGEDTTLVINNDVTLTNNSCCTLSIDGGSMINNGILNNTSIGVFTINGNYNGSGDIAGNPAQLDSTIDHDSTITNAETITLTGQTDIDINATLVIGPGTILDTDIYELFVGGSDTLINNGEIDNSDGTIKLNGSFINNGVYSGNQPELNSNFRP